MNDYRSYTCPACQGKGCQLCQGKGTVMATAEQMERAKSLIQQAVRKRQSQTDQTIAQAGPEVNAKTQTKTNWAGFVTALVVLVLSGGATASYVCFKSLKPFLASLITLLIAGANKLLWNSKLVKPDNIKDFLTAIDHAQT